MNEELGKQESMAIHNEIDKNYGSLMCERPKTDQTKINLPETICIYHNRDFDGFCSAAIVKLSKPEAKFIGWDYGMAIPMLPQNAKVFMVDISFPMPEMVKVAREGRSLVWIDHHKSAIEEYKEFIGEGETFCSAILDSNYSACELTWMKFFSGTEIPKSVRLLGIYDSWRESNLPSWESEVMPFQMGLKTLCNGLDTFPMELLNNETAWVQVLDIIEVGKKILAFQGWLGGIYGKDGECSQEMPIWSTVKPKIDKLTKHKPTKEGI